MTVDDQGDPDVELGVGEGLAGAREVGALRLEVVLEAQRRRLGDAEDDVAGRLAKPATIGRAPRGCTSGTDDARARLVRRVVRSAAGRGARRRSVR